MYFDIDKMLKTLGCDFTCMIPLNKMWHMPEQGATQFLMQMNSEEKNLTQSLSIHN